jgi:translation initiation factor 1
MADVKSSKAKGGLVYSTDLGRTCPKCRQAVAQCSCDQSLFSPAGDGVVRVSRETKGRGGKCVTLIRGLSLDANGINELAKTLKAACGSGGTVKDGVIEIQGDHGELLVDKLKSKGWLVKRVGA